MQDYKKKIETGELDGVIAIQTKGKCAEIAVAGSASHILSMTEHILRDVRKVLAEELPVCAVDAAMDGMMEHFKEERERSTRKSPSFTAVVGPENMGDLIKSLFEVLEENISK